MGIHVRIGQENVMKMLERYPATLVLSFAAVKAVYYASV